MISRKKFRQCWTLWMIHSDDITFDKEKAQQKETIDKTNHRKRELTDEPEVNTTEVTNVFKTILQVIETKNCKSLEEQIVMYHTGYYLDYDVVHGVISFTAAYER